MTRPCYLYRLYGTAGELLYVGIAYYPADRIGQHRSDKPWWPEVTGRRVERYPDRPSAERAERAAIVAELPRYNRLGHPCYVHPRKGTSALAKSPRSIRFPDDIERDLLTLGELDRRAFQWLVIEAARLMIERRRPEIDAYRARTQP